MEYTFGRPPMYLNPEEMQEKISEYFATGRNERDVIVGKGENATVVKLPVLTITGLALYLGFESRQSFYDYEKNDHFSYTIKRARAFIEREYEELLQFGNVTGAIFALKNFGWTDKSEVDYTTGGEPIGKITVNIIRPDGSNN